MFLALNSFWGEEAPPKLCTGIIKLNTVPSIVQNFVASGRWSLEISQESKKGKKLNDSKT